MRRRIYNFIVLCVIIRIILGALLVVVTSMENIIDRLTIDEPVVADEVEFIYMEPDNVTDVIELDDEYVTGVDCNYCDCEDYDETPEVEDVIDDSGHIIVAVARAASPTLSYTDGTSFSVPPNQTTFKSWMPGSAVTNTKSAAYKIISMAQPDSQGQYQINGHYLVALGSYYSTRIGDIFEITLSSGKVFTIALGDRKADAHTDALHQRTRSNGCIMEFIIHQSTFRNSPAYRSGDMSSNGFSGTVTAMTRIGNVFD